MLRVGVLGCGPIAQFAHFDAVVKARNAQLYAICDVAEDLLGAMAARHTPVTTFTDYDTMLADPNVDAVLIAVADQYHVALCRRALEAGKHVLVEKPLGVTVEECADLVDAVTRSGLVLQVGNNRRFDPGIAYARTFVHEEMGALLALKAWYCDSVHRYTVTNNLAAPVLTSGEIRRPAGDPKSDRQRYLMLAHGSHLVDTARVLGDEIVQVEAKLAERFGAYCWFVAVEFRNGAVGHLDLTVPVRGDFEEGFRIYGEFGSVNGRLFHPWYYRAGEVECFSVHDDLYRRPFGQDAHTYKLQVEGFAATILDGAPQVGANAHDGLRDMQIMVAIARSVATGRAVDPDTVSGGV